MFSLLHKFFVIHLLFIKGHEKIYKVVSERQLFWFSKKNYLIEEFQGDAIKYAFAGTGTNDNIIF